MPAAHEFRSGDLVEAVNEIPGYFNVGDIFEVLPVSNQVALRDDDLIYLNLSLNRPNDPMPNYWCPKRDFIPLEVTHAGR